MKNRIYFLISFFIVIGFSFLLPNHYYPWFSAYQDFSSFLNTKYGYETGNGVFNGEFGTILKLDDIDKVFILHDLYSIEETKQIKQKVKEIIDNK